MTLFQRKTDGVYVSCDTGYWGSTNRTAVISSCGKYRYELGREWEAPIGGDPKALVFLMLNPSTADAYQDDPTIRRCIRFAEREGCNGIVVVNLFAYRATNPDELLEVVKPVGVMNNHHINRAAAEAGRVVCAYGAVHPRLRWRADDVVSRLRNQWVDLYCLGKTKDGSPRHPLYVKADAPLQEF